MNTNILFQYALSSMPAGVIERIRSQSESARLFGTAAFAAALLSVVLFFSMRIPRCIRGLTGLGKKREIARMSRKNKKTGKKEHTRPVNNASPEASPLAPHSDALRDRPLPDGFEIEFELP